METALPSSYQNEMNSSAAAEEEMAASINCSLGNASSVSCDDLREHVLRLSWPVFWLVVIIVLVLLGNGLVCFSVWREPRLQNMVNFFLVSLAVGDILDSIIVMPLAITKAYLGSFPGPRGLAEAWYLFDLIFMTSTIVHVCVISLDRCIGLKQPLWYCKYNTVWHIKLKIALTWCLVVGLSLPAFLLHPWDNSLAYMGYQICGVSCRKSVLLYGALAFLLPLMVTAVSLTLAIYAIYLGFKLIRTDVHVCTSMTDESFGTTIRETSSAVPRSRSPSFQVASLNASFKSAQRKSLSFGNFNSSFRGSKKRKGSRRETSGPGSSPKLDRHPSLRYSVRRKPLNAKDMALGLQPAETPTTTGGTDSGTAIGMALRRASIQDIRQAGDSVSSFTHSPHGSLRLLTGSFRLNHRSFHGSPRSQPRGGSLRQVTGSFKCTIPEAQHLRPVTSNKEETSAARTSLLSPTDNNSAGGCSPTKEEEPTPGTSSPLLSNEETLEEETDVSNNGSGARKPDSLSLVPMCSDNSVMAVGKKLLAAKEEHPVPTTPTTTMTGQICRTKGSLKRHINKESQTARIIAVMLVTYLVFHLPYFAAILADGLCDSCGNYFAAHAVFALEWLSFSIRAVTPIIYHTLNRDFRQSFVRLLHIG